MSPTERDNIQAPPPKIPEPAPQPISDMERFKLEDFTLLKVIGKGSFGKVSFSSNVFIFYLIQRKRVPFLSRWVLNL